MKKTMSAITAAAAVTSCFTGLGLRPFQHRQRPQLKQTHSQKTRINQPPSLSKTSITPPIKGKCLSRRKALPLTKAQKGMSTLRLGNRKDQSGETIDLIYITGIWDSRATDFPIIKT